MTKPKISIIRKSDGQIIESVTLKNARGKIFAFALDDAWKKAARWSEVFELTAGTSGEFYFVKVERMRF